MRYDVPWQHEMQYDVPWQHEMQYDAQQDLPFWMPSSICSLLEVGQHVRVIALKLAYSREAPSTITFGIGRVAQLTSRTQANRHLNKLAA